MNINTALDQWLYNTPTVDEVAAILIDGFPSDETKSPCIVLWGKSDKSHTIYHYYGCYDPLQYPILFPKVSLDGIKGSEKFVMVKYLIEIVVSSRLLRG